jgi:hypothetical protein
MPNRDSIRLDSHGLPFSRPVSCQVCDEIVYLWPQRIDGQCFSAASDALMHHLAEAHGLPDTRKLAGVPGRW